MLELRKILLNNSKANAKIVCSLTEYLQINHGKIYILVQNKYLSHEKEFKLETSSSHRMLLLLLRQTDTFYVQIHSYEDIHSQKAFYEMGFSSWPSE